MRATVGLSAALILTSQLAIAQPMPASPKALDPFDTSAAREKVGKLGIPTQALVADLEAKAKALVDGNDCRNAIPALESYAKQANTLSNLISAGLQPFYGASYDDRKKANVGALVKFEALSNDYKMKRNRAIVLQAECAAKLGQRDQAATLFVHALNLIDVDDREWWGRARSGLYEFIQVK